MKCRVEVVYVYVNADGVEQRREVLSIELRELAMETLGMNLKEGKAVRIRLPAQTKPAEVVLAFPARPLVP